MTARGVPVRFRILGMLVLLSFVNYLLRNNLSVMAPSITEEFGFTNAEMGWILGSFNLSYALLQVPGGWFGQLLGPRRALAAIAVSWGVLTWLTGFAPSLMAASAAGAMVALVVVRFLLGVSNAPTYPVVAASIESWFPPGRWAFGNAMSTVGVSLGQAAIGPIVTAVIIAWGWRASCYVLAPAGILAGLWWYWYARDRPREHRAVQPDEAALIDGGRVASAAAPGGWRKAMMQRDVLLLAASYFCMNYVFYMFAQWLFIYLVDERKFTLLESGWLYVLPFATGAVLALAGGVVCDWLCRRRGARFGCRATGMTGLLLVAGFMLAGAYAPDPYVAVVLLSLCFGFVQSTDGAFWSATTYVAGPNTASATGVLNFGGNLPGLLAPVVGMMVDHLGWLPTIVSGSFFALLGAGLWMLVRLDGEKP